MARKRLKTWPLIKDHPGWLGGFVDRFRTRSRRVRADMFLNLFELSTSTRVLDLGSGDGAHIHAVLEGSPVTTANTYIADIDEAAIDHGADRYGYIPVVGFRLKRIPGCPSLATCHDACKFHCYAFPTGFGSRRRARISIFLPNARSRVISRMLESSGKSCSA